MVGCISIILVTNNPDFLGMMGFCIYYFIKKGGEKEC